MLRGFSPCAIDDHAFDHHLARLGQARDGDLELVRDRQEEQVREPDAVDGRDERRGDAVAELARVGEVLHHRHQAEHRADDAERRRVDAHALEYFRGARIGLLAHVQVHFENAADHVGLAAVDHQLQSLAHEIIGLAFDHRLEPEQALLARDVAPLDHLLDQVEPRHRGGLKIHGRMRIACFITGSGVCTQIAAMVPTTTIMKAAADSSALMPAPLSTAPTRIATVSASTRPTELRMSMRRPSDPEA